MMLLSLSHDVVYQKSDSPRYFKANKGLLAICAWMCVSSKLAFLLSPWQLRIHGLTEFFSSYNTLGHISIIDGEIGQRRASGMP